MSPTRPHRAESRRPRGQVLQFRRGQISPRHPPQSLHLSLPRELASFVGRAQDVGSLLATLGAGTALTTVVGMGGVGKTRLAAQVAARIEHTFSAGACFVSFEQLDTGADPTNAVLDALGIRCT